jgi:predicted RNase H-like HicB family nuclease
VEAEGWVIARTRGSHRQYRHPTKRGEHPEASRTGTETNVAGYVIIIEGDEEGGFSSYAPDLPGVIATATTYDECVTLMREAVAFHLDGMWEDGDPIPPPTTIGVETVAA